jgi:hypothetical protein
MARATPDVRARWEQFATAEPDLARRAQARFLANKHHVLANLRRDGSPRVSGTEVQFHGGDLCMGMMHQSIKARDLVRDGRFALHANPGDATMKGGDAKVAGVAFEVTDEAALATYIDEVEPPPPFHLFRSELSEVVVTSLHPDGDRLVIETWRPGTGVVRRERS